VRRLVAGPLLVLMVGLGWFGLAPTQLGGSNSYVTTHGNSMEPDFSAGDLAVIRSADDYRVGEVIAYHSETLKTVVMHRIVAVQNYPDDQGTQDTEDSTRYTLRGDHNSWLDPDHPARDQVVGTLALRIPQGGIWLDRLTSPAALGLIAFTLMAGGGNAVQRRRRRRRRNMSQHMTRDRRAVSAGGLPPWARSAGVVVALAALAGVLLAIPAWTTTPLRSGTTDGTVDQTMTFSYRTEVRPSAAYDDTIVTSPEPVFRNLSKSVDVRYSYQGRAGSIAVAAQLSTAGGWHSTVPLRSAVSFDNNDYTGTVRLDLEALEDRAQAAAVVTGIPASAVEIAIVASVATADEATFKPALTMTLTPLQLTLVGEESSLTTTAAASTTTTATGPGTLSFAGREVSVPAARIWSAGLLLTALLAALVLALLAHRGTRSSEGANIRRSYAPILIQVQPMPTPAGQPVVDVVDFATLAKLAQRYGLLVMHWSRSNVETFIVQDEGTTYRYRTGTGTGTGAGEGTGSSEAPADVAVPTG